MRNFSNKENQQEIVKEFPKPETTEEIPVTPLDLLLNCELFSEQKNTINLGKLLLWK